MNERESLIVLNLIAGIGPVRIRKLIERFGSASAVLRQPASALERAGGIGPALSAAIAGWEKLDYREEFRLLEKHGIGVVSVFEEGYPANLKEIYDPPTILYVRGGLLGRDKLALAVVGSRRSSQYGLQAAQSLSRQLVGRGFTVVSGLARGIDAAAHRGALMGKGRTIAVLGSGLLNIYPVEHRRLADEIAGSGSVVSQFPLRMVPEKTNFPLRNRIISGLSLGVLVVEAARKSGALITVHQALEQGRLVMAVPGRIDSFSAQGTNQLIQEGAKMVRSVEDILEEFEYLYPSTRAPRQGRGGSGSGFRTEGATGLPAPAGGEGAASPGAGLSLEEETVLRTLSEEEKEINQIVREAALPVPAASAALLSLELKRLVKQLPGKYYIKISGSQETIKS